MRPLIKKLTLDTFIEKSIKNHEILYDYSKVNYSHNNIHVTIICPFHGEFLQKPNVHIRGSDCPSCSRLKQVKKRSTIEDFIIKANLVHNNKYDYSKSIYTLVKNKLTITCPIHRGF